jgi:non-lysosomal glucosylceramidase
MQSIFRLGAILLLMGPLAAAAADEGDPLAQLTFKNSGIVQRAMRFTDKMQDCYYVESPTAWTVGWGNPNGGARYPYLHLADSTDGEQKLLPPPVGMRSAVPLGGLGAGTVELRADGSLRDWNIFNNSPGGGGGKVQLDEALFGLRVQSEGDAAKGWTLRTHPPRGLPAIDEIEYSGAFPVSRLRFRDPQLPLGVTLYAYGTLKIRDARASAAPAILFSFVLSNRTAKPVNAAIFFNLPNHLGGMISPSQTGLCIERAGSEPMSGAMAVRFGDGPACSRAAGDDLPAIWQAFQTQGHLGEGKPVTSGVAKHAAVAASATLKPGEQRTIPLALAWYLPNRMHAGQRVGNYYTQFYRSAADVADKVLARQADHLESMLQWQHLCFDNTLPEWLQDALVNSPATMAKTGMWFEDGRWRQWESFSCSAVDPVHIYFYRSLPYMLFFPELAQSQFRGFASIQKPDGFINEDLGNSGRPIDSSQARDMGDCTSTFILGVYNQYLWSADRRFLGELWPAAKKAAQWQIDRSRSFGLPARLNNTYDWWAFQDKDVVAYNAVLHLAALGAAAKLAETQGDADFARRCQEGLVVGQKKLDELLWTGSYYRSWWMAKGDQTDALHADTLYGQLWASLLGLGWMVPPERARRHLRAEMQFNQSPFGLRVMSRRGRDAIDELVWEAGSLDWTSLNLWLGEDMKTSMAEAEKLVNVWRVHLRDAWDWRDLTRSDDGQPWCNSHYARQLILWSIPLALSGQQYSAPQQKLSFAPRLGAPARLPWFTPVANGVLERTAAGKYRLLTLSGRAELRELTIAGGTPRKDVLLEAGRAVELSGK